MATAIIRGRALGRWLCNALLSCGVLCLGCLGLRAVLQRLPAATFEEDGPPAIKARHYEEHAAEIDVVFLGSSRVFRQLNPAVFDLQTSELGQRTHAYNLGLPGLRFYELLQRIDWVLAHRSGGLRWLLIELGDPDPSLEDANLLTRRSIGWHTPGTTWIAVRSLLGSERPIARKLADFGSHLTALLCNLSNAGNGVPAVQSLLGPPARSEDALRGFLPLELDPSPSTRRHREEFLEQLAADPELLARRVAEIEQPPARSELGAFQLEVLRGLVERVRAAGVEPVFLLLPPAERNNADWLDARERGVLPHLIALDDPRRIPEFYLDVSQRFDLNHLVKTGANRLTRLVAEEFAGLVSAARER